MSDDEDDMFDDLEDVQHDDHHHGSNALEENGASLPAAEHVRSSMGGSSRSFRNSNCNNRDSNDSNTTSSKLSLKWVWIGAICSLVFLVIVVPVLAVKQNRNGASASSSSTEGGAADRPRPLVKDVMEYLLDNGVSSLVELETPGSPQNKAVRWLAELDEANMEVPKVNTQALYGYRYLSRYVVVLNYFALDGPNWSDQLNFLTMSDACFWYQRFFSLDVGTVDIGVFCDLTEEYPVPRFIHLSK